ncbi:hypothetical protein ACJQWK_09011 [Exserohilum turcicum]
MDDRSVLFLWNADSPEAKFYSPEHPQPRLRISSQILLHVHYVCLPETWSKAIEILRKIDRYFTLERTYDYTPEDVYVTLIKL